MEGKGESRYDWFIGPSLLILSCVGPEFVPEKEKMIDRSWLGGGESVALLNVFFLICLPFSPLITPSYLSL